MVKGLAAGSGNVVLALATSASFPRLPALLGAARTGAYFSTAPFDGALLAVPLLGESWTFQTLAAAILMGGGVHQHLTERHAHLHDHPLDGPHSHVHRHERMTHSRPHFPDAHHQHEHSKDA